MRADPAGLFGDDDVLRISCPRCGARHIVSREALEAHLSRANTA
jgi:molecular chaperone Hsp33